MTTNFSGFMAVICDRWINEVAGTRCVLDEGHPGPCRASFLEHLIEGQQR